MEIFVPVPPEGSEWVVVDDYRELEKMLAAGPRRIPFWRWPIRAIHVGEDEDGLRRRVDAPWMGSHGFVVKPAAEALLKRLFAGAAQFVPIGGTPYRRLRYVHIHRLAAVLDEERSEIVRFDPGPDIMDIVRHEFLPSVSEVGPVFKLRQMPRGDILLRDDAVEAIDGSGLSGYAFQRVWSSG